MWFNCTTDTSAVFTGLEPGIYYFRSQAQDNADNWESFPTNPDYDTYVDSTEKTRFLATFYGYHSTTETGFLGQNDLFSSGVK